MAKVCLSCGGKSHTYVDGIPVCDDCGKGSSEKQSLSFKCLHHYHEGCSGKCRSSVKLERDVDYASNQKFILIDCECFCHGEVNEK